MRDSKSPPHETLKTHAAKQAVRMRPACARTRASAHAVRHSHFLPLAPFGYRACGPTQAFDWYRLTLPKKWRNVVKAAVPARVVSSAALRWRPLRERRLGAMNHCEKRTLESAEPLHWLGLQLSPSCGL